jgi:hypothetical protein
MVALVTPSAVAIVLADASRMHSLGQVGSRFVEVLGSPDVLTARPTSIAGRRTPFLV